MEVIVALAIFLVSFVAIGSLMNAATARAHEARTYTIAMQLAQSKLSEFVAGVQPLNATGAENTPFDFDPTWVWSAKCDVHPDPNVANLFLVEVRVSNVNEPGVDGVLTQCILDPTYRGTTMGMSPATPPKTKKTRGG